MKKKIVCIIITFAICAGNIVPAFAAETAPSGYSHNNISVTMDFSHAESFAGNKSGADSIASHPLDGAVNWARNELHLAFCNDLIIDDMIGKWTQPTTRQVAAEAIVRLLESVTGKTIVEIAQENEYDLTDRFTDTTNNYANFLKQSGISNGVDGVRYDPEGTFTRAQMVTMLGRMAKGFLGVDTESFPKGSTLFKDVPDWADEFVGWAGAVGITDGIGGGRFDPNGTLQNQHTGVFIWRTFAHYYKSPYELKRTGEYITVEQMDTLKSDALSWQSTIAIVGDFAEIVAIEPADGSDQIVYVRFRRFDRDLGKLVIDDDGYEKMQIQKPDGVEARILFADSGGGSGELIVGYRFIFEDSEHIEVFYASNHFIYNDEWENITIYQQEYIQLLSERVPDIKYFK